MPFQRKERPAQRQRQTRVRRNPLLELKIDYIDYKNIRLLSRFINEQGKILPRRITGLTAGQQRMLTTAIKRARHLAYVPYVGDAVR